MRFMQITSLAAVLTAALGLGLVSEVPAASPNGPLMLKKFGSFYVGGRDIPVPYTSTHSGIAMYDVPGLLRIDQMYVQYMIPWSTKHKFPVVFVHGGALLGKTWEETPDGREGWVNYFTRQGFDTYWVDKPWRGSSPFNINTISPVSRGDADPSTLPMIITRDELGAWKDWRFGPALGVLNPGNQFPLEGADQLFDQIAPDFSLYLRGSFSFRPNPVVIAAVVALLEKIGPAIYVGHSQGGAELPDIVKARPDLFAGVISVEGGCPPVADVALYQHIPFVIVTGDYTTPPASCQLFIAALNGLGGSGTNLFLPDIGITGNGHMMMMGRNSDQIAQVLIDWIGKQLEGRVGNQGNSQQAQQGQH